MTSDKRLYYQHSSRLLPTCSFTGTTARSSYCLQPQRGTVESPRPPCVASVP
ncbi:hypothetical protein IG631_10295 [Alternaria alternata]|nr:hypothetical protein IG631_10295 [Alternaria alternata]